MNIGPLLKFHGTRDILGIVEYSDDAIIGKTPGGIITSWNPAAERMYGYLREEIIGKSVELLSPENRAGEMTAILSRISAGQHLEPLRPSVSEETERCSRSPSGFHRSVTLKARSSERPRSPAI